MSKLIELVEEYGDHKWSEGSHEASYSHIAAQSDRADARALLSEIRAAVAELERDAARLDWLADKENSTGGVILPTDCVLEHLDDMRSAIDAAMESAK